MLQPQQTTDDQALMTSRIIWGALTFSMLMYGFVLFQLGKVSAIFLPGNVLEPLEVAALAANGMAIVTFMLHKTKIVPIKSFQQRFTLYIVCWALNEAIVLVAFAATFVGESGNGFFYLANLTVAMAGNLLTFPRK